MASISIESVRKEYPGMTDREAAAAIASKDPSVVIIVRYKLTRDGEYTNFGICYSREEAENYVCNDGIGIHGVNNIYLRKPPRMDPALILAAEDGDTVKVRELIDDGVDVNTTFEDNWGTKRAITRAALKGHLDIVKLLIENGADLSVITDNDCSILDDAFSSAAEFGYTDLARYLIDKGADVNYKNKYGGFVFSNTARDGHTETLKLLIDKGVDLNVKTDENCSVLDQALYWAADEGCTDTVKFLLDKGADVNSGEDWTALMTAAMKERVETVRLLIEQGADINAKNESGKTALDIAEECESSDIVELLKVAGCRVAGTV